MEVVELRRPDRVSGQVVWGLGENIYNTDKFRVQTYCNIVVVLMSFISCQNSKTVPYAIPSSHASCGAVEQLIVISLL